MFDDQIELADEGGEGTRFGHLAEFSLQRLADPLVRIGPENVIHACRTRLVGEMELLREAHVRQDEDDLAALFLAQDFHVSRQVGVGAGKRDAA